MTDRALFQTFQQSKLSPNDRVYLNSARARMTTKLLTVGALSFGTVYFLKAFKDRKKLYKPRRWPWALLGSIIVTVPTMTLQAREEYRRAIIDLDDHSYLRKYLFDSAVVTNPDLNAQQIYSKIAIEEYEQQQRNSLADSGQLPYTQSRPRNENERW